MLSRTTSWIGLVAWFLCLLASGHGQEMSKEDVIQLWYRVIAAKKQGKYADAAALSEKLLPSAERIYGKDGSETATILNNLGLLYHDLAQYARAEPLFERSLQIREARFGRDHTEVAQSLNNLALLYRSMGRYAQAEPLYERSLRIYEARLGKDHPDVATSLNNLALLYRSMGYYARAVPLAQRSLQIREAKLGQDHPDVALGLNNLALLYRDMGEYAQLEPLFQRSLQIREAKFGKDHPAVANSLNNLAGLYRDLGQYARAEPLFERSLQIDEARLGKDHPEVATPLNNLAGLYRGMGQYAKAEPLFQRSLQIREAKLGKHHPDVANSLNNLALVYRDMGQYARAQPLFERSLQIYEAKLGKDHPDVAIALNNLARLYNDMGQSAKAQPLMQRSLQIHEARHGKNHPEVANFLNNLALVYRDMGQNAKAEPLYKRSLQIYETRLGKDHPHVATSLNNLALLYGDMGQFVRAEPLFERSLQIHEARLGKDHPHVATSLNNLAWNLASQMEWTRAVGMVQLAQRSTIHHLADILPGLSEKEQLNLLQAKFARDFHRALSLGWSARPETIAPSAAWLLNGKAIAHQSLAEQHLLARDAKDPKSRQLVADLQNTRASLAALINRLPRTGLEKEYQQQMQQLKAREQELAQQLARAVGRLHRTNPWITLDELRAKLGPKTVFVDIARFDLFDFAANQSKGPYYVAWITPPQGQGDIQLIDLGKADVIDQLVKQTRKSLLDSARTITKVGEVEAAAALHKPLQQLSATVLHPLLPALQKYEEWVVCPDGALWLTPWNALVLPDGKFTVEKYLIRHVVSGRDLVLELPKAKAVSAYLFADPDYDLSPGKVMAAAGALRSIGGTRLVGQRLHGSIATWKVSFEFLDNEVLIRDEEDNGKIAGKASWKLQGNTLTMQTSISRFEGTIEATEIRGQRRKRNDDGTTSTDTFRMEHPHGKNSEARFASSALAILPRVLRLPSTALEAEAVRPKIQQWLGQEPKVFLEDKASETMFKSIHHPRVLILATHGYFLPAQEVESKDRPGLELGEGQHSAALLDKKGQPIENPLLRCGLLLAGCNKRGEAQPGEDDGILTGLEIVGMDMNGCELVVLSACETGLGDVRSGEGVAGLRQAFQLAGAKAVLASLWQVSDRETALLMNGFYGELTRGRRQSEALRQAQLQRIASRRAQFGAAHPFFWSAFALTSRGTD